MNIIQKFATTAFNTYIRNKPAIMTGIAIVSVVTTAAVALKEGPVIVDILDERKKKVERIKNDADLTEEEKGTEIQKANIDAVKRSALPVGKVALAAGISIFSILGINKAYTMREAAAGALLETYKTQVIGYEEKLEDLVGKDKAEEVKNEVLVKSSEKLSEKYGTNKRYKEISYKDTLPCVDDFGSRWAASQQDNDRAFNFLAKEMYRDKGNNPKAVSYSSFFREYFGVVDLRPGMDEYYFDPTNYPEIEQTHYYDELLDTFAIQVHYKYGEPVHFTKSNYT